MLDASSGNRKGIPLEPMLYGARHRKL